MRKMQEIQPEVKAIQERYAKLKATDPAKQKMNQELMALYRERGVNPAAGCVPMLLTMPVFFAFYALLYDGDRAARRAVLRLDSRPVAPDPFYVTPMLMVRHPGAGRQWMTPAAGMDPTQQKMMLIMPIVLSFIFLWMPAGVVIYWVVNNVWGIGQQVADELLDRPAEHSQPAAAGGAAREARGRRQDRSAARGELNDGHDATQPIVDFLKRVTAALGIRTPVDVEETRRRPAPEPFGRRSRAARAASRRAAQGAAARRRHGVRPDAAGRDVACSSTRSPTAKARTSSSGRWRSFSPRRRSRPALDQQLGPLNPYERRIVHMAVAEVPGVTTESVGDAFSKTVLISLRK